MASQAYSRFLKKIRDVELIMEISGSGKARRLKVLHKSGIALLAASWETYIEELLKESSIFILNHSLDPSDNAHKEIIATVIANLESKLKNFNTPKSGNILNEFRALGINDIRKAWDRRRMKPGRAPEVLDEFISQRHKIVHGDVSDPSYNKNDLISYKKFIEITVRRTDSYLRQHLYSLIGINPW